MQRLQLIQNSLARAVTRTPRHHHLTPVLKSLHWLKIPERILFKVLSLTYSLPSPRTSANSSPSSQPALLDHHHPVSFSSPGRFSSHVLQPSHIHHCTTSLE